MEMMREKQPKAAGLPLPDWVKNWASDPVRNSRNTRAPAGLDPPGLVFVKYMFPLSPTRICARRARAGAGTLNYSGITGKPR